MSLRSSVVIAVYDGRRFLKAALDSVLRQRRPADEILVCDDGSADGSAEVVRSYGPRVTLIQQANAGVSAARNAALRAAGGDVIAFLDQDDQWEPEHLAALVGALEDDSSLGAAFADSWVVDADDRLHGRRSQHLRMREGRIFADLLRGNFVPVETLVVRRSALEQVGVFDERCRYLEDWELCLRLARHHPFARLSRPLARYRIHQGNLSWRKAALLREHAEVLERLLAGDDPLSVCERRTASQELTWRRLEMACHLLTLDRAEEAQRWFEAGRGRGEPARTARYLAARSLHRWARGPFLAWTRRQRERRSLYGISPPEDAEQGVAGPPDRGPAGAGTGKC